MTATIIVTSVCCIGLLTTTSFNVTISTDDAIVTKTRRTQTLETEVGELSPEVQGSRISLRSIIGFIRSRMSVTTNVGLTNTIPMSSCGNMVRKG